MSDSCIAIAKGPVAKIMLSLLATAVCYEAATSVAVTVTVQLL